MAEPVSSGEEPSSPKPPTVYITVDFSPSGDGAATGASGSPTGHHGPALWEPPDPEDLGRVLPGYMVLALIGSGGMGAVYRARQKSLDRLVAVKVLSPELAERAPEFTERFNNEAGALAKLSHPSIVHLFDCGRTTDGQLFIAMELVEGRDVAERLAGKQPLPAKQALSIAIAVCEALEHAHRRGVVHRDIKPANVMLDAAGRVKITDFGLARIIQMAVPKERQTTAILGTPRFTAPEALVPGADVDARADIFSTGVMLYQMLTGEVPRGAAPPPSEMEPGLDPQFDAIVFKAMAEDPNDRHADATKLREALEIVRDVPTLVEEPAPAPAQTLQQAVSSAPRAAPQPYYHPRPDYEADPAAEPPRSSSLMPWMATLAVLAIAGFWAWRQLKQPDDGARANPKPVTQTTAETVAAIESATAPVPVQTTPPSPPAPEGVPTTTIPAPPTQPPAAAPSAEETAETERRITQIRSDFTTGVAQWQAGQDAKIAQLDAQYLRGVRTSITAMRNARQLADVAGLEEEERLLTSRTSLPPLAADAPAERTRLRGIYDTQALQIARAGAEAKVELYERHLGSLLAYQSILKQTNKAGSADRVGRIMEQSVKERDALRASLDRAPPPP